MKIRTLPLGVDFGTTRVRVAFAASTGKETKLQAVATRDVPSGVIDAGAVTEPNFVAAVLEDAVKELRTPERRCVCAVGEPDAVLRTITLPTMTGVERERCARFEAERYVDFPVAEAIVRMQAADRSSGSWALGIARTKAVSSRRQALRSAGLQPLAIDYDGCALKRVLRHYDAAIDVGQRRTTVHVLSRHVPSCFHVFAGGATVTGAIARDLSIDETTAENRKRLHGTAGAGEAGRVCLLNELLDLVGQAKRLAELRRIGLLGNGARLDGFCADLETATGSLCEFAVTDLLRTSPYAEDVVEAAAPDWTLAAALCLWQTA